MRFIIRNLILGFAIAAVAALAAPIAKAQNVKVPFGFSAAGQNYPAGTYIVEKDLISNSVTLHYADGLASFTWILAPGDPAPNDTSLVLRFVKSDGKLALDSIQYRNMITPHLVKQIATTGSTPAVNGR